MTETNPILYILMRTDIPDMVPGKGMAQAAHAANMFDNYISHTHPAYLEWAGSRHFGVTIVKAATSQQASEIFESRASLSSDTLMGTVVDESYPIKPVRGPTYTVEETTCWFVFCGDTDPSMQAALRKLELY